MKQSLNENEFLWPTEEPAPRNNYAIPVAVVLAGMIIAGALIFTSNQQPTNIKSSAGSVLSSREPEPTTQAVDINKVNISGRPFIGKANAKITMAYWYDYQCPFCKKFELETMPSLIADYIASGDIKIVFKNFQFLGDDSQIAGLVGQAVWEIAPDKFYQWHSAVYEKQDSENSGWGAKEDIVALAASFGIDPLKLNDLLASKVVKYQKILDDDFAEGKSFGIGGTPTAIIEKRLIIGAQPYFEIRQVIDQVLAKI